MKKLWQAVCLLVTGSLSITAGFAAAGEVPEGYRDTMKALTRARTVEPRPVSDDLQLFRLAEDLWVHRSYFEVNGQRFHSNGMLAVGERQITVIDTPWTQAASRDLLDWLASNYPDHALRLVVTHAHDDRMGGISAFADDFVPVYSHEATARIARAQGWVAPNLIFDGNLPLRTGEHALELYFPGAGHAPDNILVWFPHQKVLFGGCMVRSRHAGSLGNLADADRANWPKALQGALARYPGVEHVVPGHGQPGDIDLLYRTLELLGQRTRP